MKKRNYIFLLTFLLFAALAGYTSETNSELHRKIMGLREAAAPHIFEKGIFFTHKPAAPVRYLGIAFAHENYREVHLFQRNEKGVLFCYYPLPEDRFFVDYRLVIDGLWTTDPMNPLKFRDIAGVSISRFEFPAQAASFRLKSPIRDPESGAVEFSLAARPGSAIYLAGSFNGWDPYMYKLREIEPGIYTIRLRLLPGAYQYYFYSGGSRITDPLNPEKGADQEGYEVSLLRIGS